MCLPMTDASQTDTPMVTSVEPAAAEKTVDAKTADALYLVDGSGFIFRAFHALPPLTRSRRHAGQRGRWASATC